MSDFLPGVPADLVTACVSRAPGNEIKSGKFSSPESSSALAVNGFGWFMERAGKLPPFPGLAGFPAKRVEVEAEMRFPWAGGRHPWLDAVIETSGSLIGVESKRYEPFRPAKANSFADGFDRPVWGEGMERYSSLRRTLVNGAKRFDALDAVELIKNAYGLRTQAQALGKRPVLIYLYAEPAEWANGRAVDADRIALHRADIARFAGIVAGDEVSFGALTWAELLAIWAGSSASAAHAARMQERFGPL
jgi:hypothetical protein